MNHRIVCIGSMLVDELYYCKQPLIIGTSNPAIVKRSPGGVMRNIVHHLQLLDVPVLFLSVTGNDADGKWLIDMCTQDNINIDQIEIAESNSGKYAAFFNPDGSLFTAASVNPLENYLSISFLQSKEKILGNATMIVADTNLGADVLQWLIDFANANNKILIIEPVSVAKARKLKSLSLNGLFMITPNEDELLSLSNTQSEKTDICYELLERGVKQIWLRKGEKGSEMITKEGNLILSAPKVNVKDITGAGDAALAAWIAAFYNSFDERKCMLAAHAMAARIIQVEGAVDRLMNTTKLFNSIKTYFPDEA